MEGISIIIPVFNKLETTLACIRSIRERNTAGPFEVLIVDNASTDGTPEVIGQDESLIHIRNEANIGVAGACNRGAGRARYDTLCFMHNDVLVFGDEWTRSIREFLEQRGDAGIAGLYGAKTIRRDGSFRGSSIVHGRRGSPAMTGPLARVAVLDGLLLAARSKVFLEIGGFNEAFPVHYYDKDISLRSLRAGYRNYVMNIPFEHRCSTTRSRIPGERDEREASRKRFLGLWEQSLPVDVMTMRERLAGLFARSSRK